MLIYLIVTSLILEGRSAHCFLSYARYYLAIAQSFRLFCRRLNANFTEDGPRVNVWHDWWTFLRGRLGNFKGMEVKRSILLIVENYATAIYLFVCFVGIHICLKDMDSLRGSVYYGRYKQLKGLLTSYHINIRMRWNRYMPRLVKFLCAELLFIIFRMYIHEYSMTWSSGKCVNIDLILWDWTTIFSMQQVEYGT